MGRTIIVSNRLPVSIQKKKGEFNFTPSSGGLATGLQSVYQQENSLWIGWPGVNLHSREDKEHVTNLLHEDKMHPVFLSQQDINEFYLGYSNNTLWPLFHYFTTLTEFDTKNWQTYKKVNKYFCDEICKFAGEDDTIWVHDYHLFLVCKLLREKLPKVNIGFFLHIPFPSYEIFRQMPNREEILEGIISADLIGFHTYDDMRHFLSSINRILGIPNTNGNLELQNRNAKVDAFPMGIDYDKYAKLAESPATMEKIKYFRKNTGKNKLILSVDRLDFSKGIPEKLKAFERFLENYPDYREKCDLILVVVPSRTQVETYKQLKLQIEQEVGRINGKYSRIAWTPIHFIYRSVPPESLSGMYKTSEAALITPLRDGMNLVAKEYVASKTDGKGVLIISEMAGASKELSDGLIVNPNNVNQVADAIKKAFEMPEEEQVHRNRNMQERLRRNNVHKWSALFMNKLNEVKQKQIKLRERNIIISDSSGIKDAFNKKSNRLILLDYDGTLVPFYKNPLNAKPSEEVKKLLQTLNENPKNTIVLISGREKNTIEEWWKDIDIDIIAEHGVWMKRKNCDWEININPDVSWKDELRPVFQDYVDRTPGTFIEEKGYSLVWHYRNADSEFAQLRARELVSHLEYFVSNKDLQILEGNKVVELKNASINKGTATRKWIEDKEFDFIVAMGDDHTDEDTFKSLPENAFTVKVGQGNTVANYYLSSYKEVRALLSEFADL